MRRRLKRGGSSSSRSSSSKSRSYGNCYGDRCDDTGGSVSIAVIIGIVAGGLCAICLCYVLIVWLQNKCHDHDVKKRKKRNWVHPDGDADDPKEPVVIFPENEASISADFRVDTDISGSSAMGMVNPPPNILNKENNAPTMAPGTYVMGAGQLTSNDNSAANNIHQSQLSQVMAGTPVIEQPAAEQSD